MGYSRLETGYNPAVSGVVRLPDNTVLNLTSLDWTDQIDAVIGVADEYIGYDFGNELRDFVAELGTNPFEDAYETDETDDVKTEYNKVVFSLRLLVREYQAKLSGQRTVDYAYFTAFAEDFENTIAKVDEIDAEVNTGYSREDMEYLTMSDADFNSYYREIREFVDIARSAVNDDYAVALENILAGVVDDAEYIRSDDFLMQLNPLVKYDDAFDEMESMVDSFTKAVSRKQKVTVKAFKELLANIQTGLNELPKN